MRANRKFLEADVRSVYESLARGKALSIRNGIRKMMRARRSVQLLKRSLRDGMWGLGDVRANREKNPRAQYVGVRPIEEADSGPEDVCESTWDES